jgi:hypothetical protein
MSSSVTTIFAFLLCSSCASLSPLDKEYNNGFEVIQKDNLKSDVLQYDITQKDNLKSGISQNKALRNNVLLHNIGQYNLVSQNNLKRYNEFS